MLRITVLCALLVVTHSGAAKIMADDGGNLLKNGNFERGPNIAPNNTGGVLIPPTQKGLPSPLPGWKVESPNAVKYIDSPHFIVPSGERAVELFAAAAAAGGKGESAIAQVVRTVPGKNYKLTFAVGDAADGCVGSMALKAIAGRATVSAQHESAGMGGSESKELLLRAESNRTRIRFATTFHMKGLQCGPVVDDVKLVSIRS